MNSPKITVLLPVYNGERFVKEAIESILQQTFTDFDFLIINDGSTDKSLEIINTLAKQDGRIEVISRGNKGLINTLNEGIGKARGQYIARQDADDISQPTRLQKQITYLKTHSGIGLLGTNIEVIDDSGSIIPRHIAFVDLLTNPSDLKLAEVFSNQFAHGSIIAKASLLKKTLYDREYKHAEDYDLWARLLRETKAANLKEPLYCWRLHDKGITATQTASMHQQALRIATREFEHFRTHRGQYRLFSFHPLSMRGGVLSYFARKNSIYRNMAIMYVRGGQRRRAVPILILSMLHMPWSLKSYRYLYKVIIDRETALGLDYELY